MPPAKAREETGIAAFCDGIRQTKGLIRLAEPG